MKTEVFDAVLSKARTDGFCFISLFSNTKKTRLWGFWKVTNSTAAENSKDLLNLKQITSVLFISSPSLSY